MKVGGHVTPNQLKSDVRRARHLSRKLPVCFATYFHKSGLSATDPIADIAKRSITGFVPDHYLPTSAFLASVAHGEVTLDESIFGQQNLHRLLAMVTDDDRANRDWAAFLISGLPLNTEPVREALKIAAQDCDTDTRDEAIVGLARKDREAAMKIIVPMLADEVSFVLLEAAAILGARELVSVLESARASGAITEKLQENWAAALSACIAGVGTDLDYDELAEQHRLPR